MAGILIVEDEAGLGRALRLSLSDEGYDVHWVASAEEAMQWLATRQVDLALVDLRLPTRDGIDLLADIKAAHPDTVVVLMTAHGDVQAAVRAMKLGAADFLLKPLDLEAVSLVARRNLEQIRITRQRRHEKQEQLEKFGLHRILGSSPGIEQAKALVRRVSTVASKAQAPPPNILITGETGTGKDLFARAIHYEGSRSESAFIHVNCGSLPVSLAESELFGHVKGAFTDAHTDKRGLFDLADEGTLFLDEVCSLPLPVQAKLLTAIESRRIRAVGSLQERNVNVHVVSAMNRDPQALIADGVLRADLLHRLRVVEIALPPLREREDDVRQLAEHFVEAHCRSFQMPQRSLSSSALSALSKYHWPGNVRELNHCIERAMLMGEQVIDALQMPTSYPPKAGAPAATKDSLSFDFENGPIALNDIERRLIIAALEASRYNVTRAATLLDLSRDTLRYRLEKHGIDASRRGITIE